MLERTPLIAPSILSANFADLQHDIRRAESAGARLLHLDVMDGHFVPNITFGPGMVKTIDAVTSLPLDTHLMIESPEKYLEQFRDAGADILTVHVEACTHLHRTVMKIKELGMKAGVSLNPSTPLSSVEEILPETDLILLMTVNPGFGGQKFIESSLHKIARLSAMIKERGTGTVIEVDGGIDSTTIKRVITEGAQYLVAGNAVFGDRNIESNFKHLQSLI